MNLGITGGNGFIGSNVYNYLKNKKNINIHKIDLREYEAGGSNKNFVQLDWVLHFAAKTQIPDKKDEIDHIYYNNITSTLRTISLANQYNSSILFLSTYVYGKPKYLPIDEKHPLSAINSYINSKLICEKICSNFFNAENKSIVILRCFNVYGMGLKPGRLLYDIIHSAINDKEIVINDSKPKRDYLYIADFCDLIYKIITYNKIVRNTFNVGFGESHSNIELAEIVRDLMNAKYEIKVKNIPRKNDVAEIIADISLISDTFNWSPKINLKEGLQAIKNQFNI